ncbi:DUF1045 domain-containing protein [Aliiroseovarius marinus]|uniref:DUF1045 domain-containing protein n=1 Tax=Aliiroseovarius marinus TaxID=2500159 RepID=UPI0030B85B3C
MNSTIGPEEGEMQFKRYAIYYTAPQGALADFGASWLGWDLVTGREVPHQTLPDLSQTEIAKITQTPRKYGFHGTIKPPFRLAEGCDAEGLLQAFQRAARQVAPVTLDGLKLAQIGRFLALVIDGDQAPLAALAGHMVAKLDPFRAPANDAELARRRAAGLTPAQDEMLVKWGYPYVFDEFKFHLTLSGKLDPNRAAQVRDVLAPLVAPILPRPFVVGDLTLVGEDAEGRFHEISRIALGASATA